MGTVAGILEWTGALEALLLLGCVLYGKLGPQVDGQGPIMGCAVLLTGTALNVVATPLVLLVAPHLGWH